MASVKTFANAKKLISSEINLEQCMIIYFYPEQCGEYTDAGWYVIQAPSGDYRVMQVTYLSHPILLEDSGWVNHISEVFKYLVPKHYHAPAID